MKRIIQILFAAIVLSLVPVTFACAQNKTQASGKADNSGRSTRIEREANSINYNPTLTDLLNKPMGCVNINDYSDIETIKTKTSAYFKTDDRNSNNQFYVWASDNANSKSIRYQGLSFDNYNLDITNYRVWIKYDFTIEKEALPNINDAYTYLNRIVKDFDNINIHMQIVKDNEQHLKAHGEAKINNYEYKVELNEYSSYWEYEIREIIRINNTPVVEFLYEDPTDEQIVQWRKKYHTICYNAVKNVTGYNIPREMMEQHPCCVYLVLNSKSLESQSEKQEWFDLYPRMNEEQLFRLYKILYRERYKLNHIN